MKFPESNILSYIDDVNRVPYLKNQKRLQSDRAFRLFWQFWSNYSFVLFIPAGVGAVFSKDFWEILAIGMATVIFSRGIVAKLFNLIITRQRPYQFFKFEPITSIFLSKKTNIPNSFPSRHMLTYASVSFVVMSFFPLLGIALLAISMLSGVARVILGFHYPTDIFTGYILGLCSGFIVVSVGHFLLFTIT
jgi:membrane-associated phospholipid phosphatase